MQPTAGTPRHTIRQPGPLSGRIRRLRDFYFQGVKRAWNNEYTSWTTGTDWDEQYNELTFYIVPETYLLLNTIAASYRMAARPVALHDGFWEKSLPERHAPP